MTTTHRLALALLLAPLACGRPDSTPGPARGDDEAALAVIRAYDEAWQRKDTAAYGRMLAEDYVYFSSRGDVTSRADLLALLASPALALRDSERSEVRVHAAYGAALLVGSRWRGRGTYEGEAFTDDQRCSLVLIHVLDLWRVASEHCTEIVSP